MSDLLAQNEQLLDDDEASGAGHFVGHGRSLVVGPHFFTQEQLSMLGFASDSELAKRWRKPRAAVSSARIARYKPTYRALYEARRQAAALFAYVAGGDIEDMAQAAMTDPSRCYQWLKSWGMERPTKRKRR